MTRRGLLAGTAAAGAGAAAGCARRGAGDGAPQPTGRFVTVAGTRLHYRVLGEGPPVIALHGASGNLLDWTIGPAAALARTHRVLLFDRPGLGHSGTPPGCDASDPFVQARLMADAARALGVERAHLVGHSYGGSVALAWALERPRTLSGLLLLSAPSQVWPGGVGLGNDIAAAPLIGPLAARLVPAFAGDGLLRGAVARVFAPQTPPEDYAARIDARLALRPAQIRKNAQDLTRLKAHIRAMVPRYPSLSMPVEIVHGAADTIVPPDIHSDRLAEQLPQAGYQRLHGVGHMPHHAAPEAMLTALARLDAAR